MFRGNCWLNHQPVGVARYLNVTISASSDGALVGFEMFCAFQQVTPHLYFTVYIYIPIVYPDCLVDVSSYIPIWCENKIIISS
jgi:hypothetical protein